MHFTLTPCDLQISMNAVASASVSPRMAMMAVPPPTTNLWWWAQEPLTWGWLGTALT